MENDLLIDWSVEHDYSKRLFFFFYLSFTSNSVVRHGRDAYATTFGKKSNIQGLHTQINVFNSQRWSPRGHILKSLALASKVKSLASRPQALEYWPVLGSRTALFFGMLKFCGALEKFFGKRFLVEIA